MVPPLVPDWNSLTLWMSISYQSVKNNATNPELAHLLDRNNTSRRRTASVGRSDMAKKLEGKIAVVTGASKGIGASIAKQFATEGASVVVNYASSKKDADRVVSEIAKRGGKAIAVKANVAKEAEIERLFSVAKKAFGKIDILVNNA